ncbi:sel1 repeat family protein [Pseudoalteromonas sp. SR44-5]|uniref:tetratricopeptide repeat protein n=1 Tax=Pseudoalteromonas TaxID=53246 RepID=UPI0015FFF171|nr:MULTISPECIES: tetratricopeptide repeat protein [unclassified Pseudoalteromonas]MBB1367268.1 sel1 repeat family protein [Pseudoalteromonas sp. SR44-5]MBB1418208.1 sel1 repeat family protein [Pseudoalteromonas sp. SG44-1]MBB1433753.1 sel1 repeat family protein [Pseudoalteromonas sp. SG43-6]MBB1468752.1 sel1 repeat family protein [Pseudoalteromonas sp. SG41-5]
MKRIIVSILVICFSLGECEHEARAQVPPKMEAQQIKQPLLDLFAKPKLTTEKAKLEEALILKAIADDPSAQIALANMYENDNQQKRALFWYQQAVEHGGIDEENAILKFSQQKLAQSNDPKDIFMWTKYAAEHGDISAQEKTMEYYRRGQKVKKNLIEAEKWLRKLISHEAKKPTFKLVELQLDTINSNREKNIPSAIALAKKLAESGSVDAAYFLGWLHQFGSLLDKDITKAIYWYKKAAELADIRAYRSLGWIYHSHYNDNKAAAHWYEKSAYLEDQVSQFNLAVLYHLGKGVDKDLKTAAQLYEKAAYTGHNSARINLANMYANGIGVSKNKELAEQYYNGYQHINLATEKKQSQLNIEPNIDYIKIDIADLDLSTQNFYTLHERLGIYSHSIDISKLPVLEDNSVILLFVNIPTLGHYSVSKGTKSSLYQRTLINDVTINNFRSGNL